jgi:hypothetical protein
MNIALIQPETHAELAAIAFEHPALCLQNEGYEYLSPSVRADKEKQIQRIESILREHIAGFSRFHNFKRSRDNRLCLRFDYDWGAANHSMRFIGVGYLLLDHLRDGFPPSTENTEN